MEKKRSGYRKYHLPLGGLALIEKNPETVPRNDDQNGAPPAVSADYPA